MEHGTHPERFGDWYDYLKRKRSKARYMGLQQEFISPREVARRHPLIDPKHYYAALWDEQGSDLDPTGATYAFGKSACVRGPQYFTKTSVVNTAQRADGTRPSICRRRARMRHICGAFSPRRA